MTKDNDARAWVRFNPLTQTYDTRDGTVVAAELCDNVRCLADVFHVASIRDQQRAVMAATSTSNTEAQPDPAAMLQCMVKAVEALKAQHGRQPEPLRVHPDDMDAIREAYRPHLSYPAGPNHADLFAGVRLIEDKEAPRLPRKVARP